MKNPLDSITGTIISGVVILVVVVIGIRLYVWLS